VVQVAKTDERVKAVLGLDPWVLPVAPVFREKPREIPFASIRSGQWMDKKDKNHQLVGEVIATFGEATYDLYVPDTTHTDFTLMPLLSPLMPMVGMTGPLDGAISLETVDSALVAFFEAFLEGPSDPAWFEGQVDGRYLRPADSNSDSGRKEAKAWEAVPVEISSRL
jgi:hypothetical protein